MNIKFLNRNNNSNSVEYIKIKNTTTPLGTIYKAGTMIYCKSTKKTYLAINNLKSNSIIEGNSNIKDTTVNLPTNIPFISDEDELSGKMKLAVVTTLPVTPDENTVYFIKS